MTKPVLDLRGLTFNHYCTMLRKIIMEYYVPVLEIDEKITTFKYGATREALHFFVFSHSNRFKEKLKDLCHCSDYEASKICEELDSLGEKDEFGKWYNE